MSDPAVPAERPTAEQPVASEPKETAGQALWRETKGMGLVLLAVLGFHSFIAKPFYIPSESMMPALLKGDRLVVSKYPYGWSYVSPTIPNPAAIVRSLASHSGEPWGITLPFMSGRVLGHMPKRGDIVIVTPPGRDEDYIKRAIGLPGDTIQVRDGRLILNGKLVPFELRPPAMVPVDTNAPCSPAQFPGDLVTTAAGQFCRLPIVRETLPGGVSYDTIDDGSSPGDTYGPVTVPAGHVFLMGDNRDHSADSRYSLAELGLGGPVPWENIGGRAEFITFSLDGDFSLLHPSTWFSSFRKGRAGSSLRTHGG
ncbi:signal peptidase I [Sphingomonas sp. ASV193]|uniref:signal peptidase I n=1 Tax=Sphingomonas sp. ASV193 TaxID=3144405 RepID=UPI0032E89BED